MKKCKCGQEFEPTHKRQYQCKACKRAYDKAWRAARPKITFREAKIVASVSNMEFQSNSMSGCLPIKTDDVLYASRKGLTLIRDLALLWL